jgi:hypothetical protein
MHRLPNGEGRDAGPADEMSEAFGGIQHLGRRLEAMQRNQNHFRHGRPLTHGFIIVQAAGRHRVGVVSLMRSTASGRCHPSALRCLQITVAGPPERQ